MGGPDWIADILLVFGIVLLVVAGAFWLVRTMSSQPGKALWMLGLVGAASIYCGVVYKVEPERFPTPDTKYQHWAASVITAAGLAALLDLAA